MTTFNGAIRERLDKEMREAEEVTPSDFYDIADRMGRQRRNASSILRQFYDRGLLELVKSIPNPHGGEPTKVYKVVPGAQFKIKTSGERVKDYNALIRAQQEQMATACRRLENAMERW